VSGSHLLIIIVAGFAAGAINAAVGSGTLITFPVLIALGYPPVVANVSNTIGLVPGSIAGAVGYRRELANLRPLVLRLGAASVLLVLPASSFKAAVPPLVALALVLVVLQPWLARKLAARKKEPSGSRQTSPALTLTLFLIGVYGGYFGAAQSIVLVGVLGAILSMSLQHVNAIKNVLAGATNCAAGIVFAVAADVDWRVAGLLAGASLVGGSVGAYGARRLPAPALRALIVCVGAIAVVKLAF
jgi:uncharacterized protein